MQGISTEPPPVENGDDGSTTAHEIKHQIAHTVPISQDIAECTEHKTSTKSPVGCDEVPIFVAQGSNPVRMMADSLDDCKQRRRDMHISEFQQQILEIEQKISSLILQASPSKRKEEKLNLLKTHVMCCQELGFGDEWVSRSFHLFVRVSTERCKREIALTSDIRSLQSRFQFHQDRPEDYYSDVTLYKYLIDDMLNVKSMALTVFENLEHSPGAHYLNHDFDSNPPAVLSFELRDLYRLYLNKMVQTYEKEEDAGKKRKIAVSLCNLKGLFVRSIGEGEDEKNELGESPLVSAASDGDSASVKLLLAAGADPNSVQYSDWPAWGCAAYWGHASCIAEFAGQDIEVDKILQGDYTAMMYAVQRGHLDCISALHMIGADLEFRCPQGRTPLMYAGCWGCTDAAQRLLDLGADPNATDQGGKSALDLGRESRHGGVCAVLFGAAALGKDSAQIAHGVVDSDSDEEVPETNCRSRAESICSSSSQDRFSQRSECDEAVASSEPLDTLHRWVDSFAWSRLLVQRLPYGSVENPWSGILELGRKETDAICEVLLPSIQELLHMECETLRRTMERVTAIKQQKESSNTKFEVFQMIQGKSCGSIADFLAGLEGRIGHPRLNILAGMELEHCKMADSENKFTTSNYLLTTWPQQEWQIVTNYSFGRRFASHERRIQPIETLLGKKLVKLANLTRPEVLAVSLYTGPMFEVYNCVLRRFPLSRYEQLQGNNYRCTIYALVSAVMKIQRVMKFPEGLVLYRGLGGASLPEEFFKVNSFGTKGITEFGFMSTTAKKSVALNYSKVKEGNPVATVFSLTVGAVDRAASIKQFSQYPGEEEYLWVPMTYLEPQGKSGLEVTEDGIVTLIPVRANSNLKSSTVEEMQSRRKMMHIAEFGFQIDEVKMEVSDIILALAPSAKLKQMMDRLLGRVLERLQSRYRFHADQTPEFYLDNAQFKYLVTDMLDFKSMALTLFENLDYSPFDLVEEDDDSFGQNLYDFELREIYRHFVKKMVQDYEFQEDAEKKRKVAENLCKLKGLIVRSIGEGDEEKNELGESPLVRAGAEGNSADVKLLLAAGADPSSVQYSNWPAWGYAAYEGHAAVIAEFAGQDIQVDKLLQGDYTAMMYAVLCGHVDCIRELHAIGADLEFRCPYGLTPLMFGCSQRDCAAAVRALLALSADPHATNGEYTAMMYAIDNGEVDSISELLATGASFDGLDGKTPLMYACSQGCMEGVLRLIELKAAVDCECCAGKTASIYAQENQHTDIVAFLERGSVGLVSSTSETHSSMNVAVDELSTDFDVKSI